MRTLYYFDANVYDFRFRGERTKTVNIKKRSFCSSKNGTMYNLVGQNVVDVVLYRCVFVRKTVLGITRLDKTYKTWYYSKK